MNPVLVVAAAIALSSIVLSGSAQAAGCLKGAVVGGAAGHYAGHMASSARARVAS